MKLTIKFLIGVVFSFSIQVKAQDYTPMAVENANWIIVGSDGDSFPPFNDDLYYGYKIQGDTIVNGVNYKKVYSRLFFSLNASDPEEYAQPPFVAGELSLFGAIRDDVEHKKVYGIMMNCNEFGPPNNCNCDTEFLMYDFDKQVGDFINEQCISDNNYNDIVEIVVADVFENPRRVLRVENDYNYNGIIEGIGNMHGLFEHNFDLADSYSISLYDFCIGEDQECFGENFLLAKKDYDINRFNIFPNPTKDKLEIKFNNLLAPILDIKITNILGEKLGDFKIDSLSNEIDISNFKSGVYFIYVFNNQKLITSRKIIKK